VEGDEDLHYAALARLDPGEGQDRDGGLGVCLWVVCIVINAKHLNHEQLLTWLLMALHEKFIAMKTLVLAPLCDLRW
jgi:hypothetical protein